MLYISVGVIDFLGHRGCLEVQLYDGVGYCKLNVTPYLVSDPANHFCCHLWYVFQWSSILESHTQQWKDETKLSKEQWIIQTCANEVSPISHVVLSLLSLACRLLVTYSFLQFFRASLRWLGYTSVFQCVKLGKEKECDVLDYYPC